MGSDTLAAAAAAYSINTSQKPSNYDEIFMRNSLQFADCLKDLKNLGKQLYSAAEHFEASYNQEDHQQFVVESSKDYVAQALVSTVDHLGSIADKLNKFLDEKAKEFSATKIRFSCIEQRINTFQGFIDLRGISRQSLEIEAPKNHKRYILPETSHIDKSKFMYKNCISCPESDTYMHVHFADNSFTTAFQKTIGKPNPPPVFRKDHSRNPSNESPPNPLNFSFTRIISSKETGKRSISPLRFPLKRSGSATNRSVSLSPSDDKQRWPSEPRRTILPQMANREREIVTYTKKSKHLFKALLSIHRSRKDMLQTRMLKG